MVVFAFPESTFLFLGFAYDEQRLFAEWSERGAGPAELGSRGLRAIAESELRIAVGTLIAERPPAFPGRADQGGVDLRGVAGGGYVPQPNGDRVTRR
jgi:hypothetical protein